MLVCLCALAMRATSGTMVPAPSSFVAKSVPQDVLDFAQAYAMKRQGRNLNSKEMEAVQARLLPHQTRIMHAEGIVLRRLESKDELSKECEKAIGKMVKDYLKDLAKAVIDLWFDCWYDEESEECKASHDKVDKFEEEFKAKCKNEGTSCDYKMEGKYENGTAFNEEDSVCVPDECHDEVHNAAQEALEEMHKAIEEEAKKETHGAKDEEAMKKGQLDVANIQCGDRDKIEFKSNA